MAKPRGGVIADQPAPAEVLAALPVAVLLIGPDDRIWHANAAAETLFNRSQTAMAGRLLADIAPLPGDVADRGGRDHGLWAYDVDLVMPHGRFRVDLVEAPIADQSGWRLLTVHNLSSPHRIGHGAEQSGGSLAAIGAAAILAHEIKNPLSGIRGAAQLLASDGASDAELTGLITAEVDRIVALIDRMEDFTDTRPLATEALNVYSLLDHARRVALAGFAREVVIEERFDPSLPSAIVNRDAFLQVMLNLLKNAAEAVDGTMSPRITLATAYRHGMSVRPAPGKPKLPLPIEILVIDNGPGAPADIADHLFEPFVSGKPEGKGLGLPLVDKLVGDMGGIIEYAREGDPELTVFRILLPRGQA